ncbi:hypothetical protein QA635_02950 [Bradyrhizobium brasilense]|uniref:hypothetical protein n=1 Tax=Bradyrhizobium brasilense TaxID=1419277 RepID=UPI0024B180EE|nr:hypothetical protein [Bradyrhizobium australafricanum]WFU33434.1 hypothetical protein QA635_02950 [Bradyrhizobium australafricanum]
MVADRQVGEYQGGIATTMIFGVIGRCAPRHPLSWQGGQLAGPALEIVAALVGANFEFLRDPNNSVAKRGDLGQLSVARASAFRAPQDLNPAGVGHGVVCNRSRNDNPVWREEN